MVLLLIMTQSGLGAHDVATRSPPIFILLFPYTCRLLKQMYSQNDIELRDCTELAEHPKNSPKGETRL